MFEEIFDDRKLLAKGFETGLSPCDKHRMLEQFLNKNRVLFIIRDGYSPQSTSNHPDPYYLIGTVNSLLTSSIYIDTNIPSNNPLLYDQNLVRRFFLEEIVGAYKLPPLK